MGFAPIAIVGRSCVLPGALSPEALWQLVLDRRDQITAVPAGRWRVDHGDVVSSADGDPSDRTWSDRGGYVSGFETVWDPAGFGVEADTLNRLDPLFHWALHCAREALADAGDKRRGTVARPRVSAVFGNLGFPSGGMTEFAESVWHQRGTGTHPRNRFASSGAAAIVEAALGLAPGVTCLDTACASSLYAIKLGCDQLHDGRVDMVLAGAVNRADDLFIHVGFTALSAMSRSGQSRPFHADADGLVPAEGAGFVALKRLADARRDGDHIYGILRGIGLSNDGRSGGFLAPCEAGQGRALKQAYEGAGLRPTDISLLECHATGTAVGDAAEIHSTGALFAAHPDIPIGSLKSNMGHLITAAGVAGLIKVLEALRHQLRPPTLHSEPLNPALLDSPFRVLTEVEPWDCPGIRIAAVSAFGFGGNNAHILVSENDPGLAAPELAPTPSAPLAIVGLGTVVGAATDRPAFLRALLEGASLIGPEGAAVGGFELELKGLRFPPNDLDSVLPQQLLLLKAAREALAVDAELPAERTGVFIAMEPDVEVCRFGLRWRLAQALRDSGVAPDDQQDWLKEARDRIIPTLTAAGVVGNMPNIPANRLNSQFDLGGGSWSVCAGEAGGLRSLALAGRALCAGELDAAVVGAVDLSCQSVHTEALRRLEGQASVAGDAAVVMTLKRLDDAEHDGDQILAVLSSADAAAPASANFDDRFGRSWAAGGLRDLVATALGMAHRTHSTADGAPATAIVGDEDRFTVQTYTQPAPHFLAVNSPVVDGPTLRFEAHPPAIAIGPLPVAPAPEARLNGAVDGVQWMAPAPSLPPIISSAAAQPAQLPPLPVIAAPVEAAAPTAPMATPTAAPRAASEPTAPLIADPVLAAMHQQIVALNSAELDHIGRQTALHHRFLEMQRSAMAMLGQAEAPLAPPTAAPAPMIAPLPAVPIAEPLPAPEAAPEAAPEVAPVAPRPAKAGKVAPPIPIGPTFDRRDLETHASGKISSIYGARFAVQDDFHRQVRMPEPPLLLADRITGLDAEAGSMGLGTIWSETDIPKGVWYLHQDRMPAGIMIESGQADLMLISYLGVDVSNRNDRVYRLLGCELTYYGGLPSSGDTLQYDIHMDGHATQGDIRLMFFHYDCHIDGAIRLEVRQGQAGFFTDAELADSDGCLWNPADEPPPDDLRLDPPFVACTKTEFSVEDLAAFAAGRPWDCFGPGYERSLPHTRTPRIQSGSMMLLGPISEFDPRGGPWGRGYMKSTIEVDPQTWFFDGHFKNDPCMPGTLMLEGCLQLMSFYLAACGHTLQRDGWRFEPLPETPFPLSCRGQVTPEAGVLTYELFVQELHDGPVPTLYADVLCTVDGLKSFHAARLAVHLTPAWPLDEGNPLTDGYEEPKAVAMDGEFPFDYRSLIACANGRPSEAFGPIYARFDGPGRVARLPNPPYHFLSRVLEVSDPIGLMKEGTEVVVEYDIPQDAWYFDENGCSVMPFAVLLEAALQPCGWLASYLGCALTTDTELCFRNLDGSGTVHRDLGPDAGTLRTAVKCIGISSVASMIVVSFEVRCSNDGRPVYDLDTVFGFFPQSALENQVGLPTSDQQRAFLQAEANHPIDLTMPGAPQWDRQRPALAQPMLLMIDRIERYEPEGGDAGLGAARAVKDVDPGEWFFKAHFFQDPVQPGSLGIEAMIQLLQWVMLEKGLDEGIERPRFEGLAAGEKMAWKYRGQVVPANQLIASSLEITEIRREDGAVLALAKASLWVDGKRIYEASDLGMRIVTGGDEPPRSFVLDPQKDSWLNDHCPTWNLPALPMMAMVDLLAQGACSADPVTGIFDMRIKGWLAFDAPYRLRTERRGAHMRLLATDAQGSEQVVATARVRTGSYGRRPQPLSALQGDAETLPYDSGALFHGPAFAVLTSLVRSAAGASSTLAASSGVPIGRLNPGLLDGATHGIPHDGLQLWDPNAPADKVAYPAMIPEMEFFGPTPSDGELRCEVRPDGHLGSPDFPAFTVQIIGDAGVWCRFRLVEACFEKGAIGRAEPLQRRAFLRDHAFVPGLRLSEQVDSVTILNESDLEAIDWLPGTVEGIFKTSDPAEIARREHIGAANRLHPGIIPAALPLQRFGLITEQDDGKVTVRGDGLGTLCLDPVVAFWTEWFDRQPWLVEDLYFGLIDRFIGRVVVTDPNAFEALRGRSMVYAANHQVGVESLLFSVIAAALTEVATVTLAKAEHRHTWLGTLIAHCFSYPGVADPGVIAFFDREDKASLPAIIASLSADMVGVGRSVMVHVEGTRSLDCTKPVEKMSGAFIDMAIAVDAPVVPVRFVGGLPRQTLDERIEFPIGMGRQDIYIGKPLMPEDLAKMPYGERRSLVVSSINALGPDNALEEPLAGDPNFAAAVEKWQAETGVSQGNAVLRCILEERRDRSAEADRLLEAKSLSDLGDDAVGAWLAETARRLLGLS